MPEGAAAVMNGGHANRSSAWNISGAILWAMFVPFACTGGAVDKGHSSGDSSTSDDTSQPLACTDLGDSEGCVVATIGLNADFEPYRKRIRGYLVLKVTHRAEKPSNCLPSGVVQDNIATMRTELDLAVAVTVPGGWTCVQADASQVRVYDDTASREDSGPDDTGSGGDESYNILDCYDVSEPIYIAPGEQVEVALSLDCTLTEAYDTADSGGD